MGHTTDTASVFTVAQIRQAEQPLLDAQSHPDELMQSAASAVAAAARMMLQRPPFSAQQERILLAVGAGGNGGDALYAGRDLRMDGWEVDAVLLGRDRDTGEVRVHTRALAAFEAAGGTIVDGEVPGNRGPAPYRLLIDGVLGMGGAGGVDERAALVLALADRWTVPLLAVDVPSGVDADTGATAGPLTVTDRSDEQPVTVLSHAVADVTVTFGGWRRAHAVSAYCGQVLLADPGVDAGGTIGTELQKLDAWWWKDAGVHVGLATAVTVPPDPRCTAGGIDLAGRYDATATGLVSPGRSATRLSGPTEPGPDDDKYTGGVVGVCAGSDRYPGAAVLATTGAVRATSAMVRYIGSGAPEVLRATPEVVWAPSVADAGRVQAWVVGPGRGTDEAAAAELAVLLARPEPLVIDADALTVLAEHPELREALIERSPGAAGRRDDRATVLTPHAGEFRRLAAAVAGDGSGVEIPDPDADRIGAAVALGAALHCAVLLKGRHTVVADRAAPGQSVTCIDAGTSWGATPGSGDVLAGIIGALMAQQAARHGDTGGVAAQAVALHALAAAVAAETPDGLAPTSASRIADAVPQAWARAGAALTSRWPRWSQRPGRI
ncbi:bifunctional ADP-dependent NAD(P)H-hydrate dehydratase/NAD(P)H-hydrate epimerase [Corynebacterium terpenotabidum]|uniref:ADP-dependent (S)-NAD(P)H-hydrate dehydratase n=1 Tax=Corynebacterium terpenotabidum Y-11 TaxID=1200352 RepID=S4XE28_9CORY|nr:bifunctional ADP-dependent NAD(P)H-hydrate dehydratase/NAD(P)H-hydrate epimerase [Corynebacterium terpenotabidum]AGP31402.1 hypothetical protein A606_08795 [Corynebacterium terpenotabidum Y-11]